MNQNVQHFWCTHLTPTYYITAIGESVPSTSVWQLNVFDRSPINVWHRNIVRSAADTSIAAINKVIYPPVCRRTFMHARIFRK